MYLNVCEWLYRCTMDTGLRIPEFEGVTKIMQRKPIYGIVIWLIGMLSLMKMCRTFEERFSI